MKNKTKTQYVVDTNYTQTNTENVNTPGPLLRTTEGKDEPDIVFIRKL